MTTLIEVAVALDPVLTPFGFAPGQGAGEGDAGQLIWCAAYPDFAAAYPWLPQAETDLEPVDYLCTDLIVELAGGSIVDVTLEGPTVEETFRDIGLATQADEVAAVIGQAADPGPTLARILPRLFVRPS